jgi:hypothetical protein
VSAAGNDRVERKNSYRELAFSGKGDGVFKMIHSGNCFVPCELVANCSLPDCSGGEIDMIGNFVTSSCAISVRILVIILCNLGIALLNYIKREPFLNFHLSKCIFKTFVSSVSVCKLLKCVSPILRNPS